MVGFGVLMVCTANLCRSPMAERLLQHRVDVVGLGWSIRSAGTRALPDQPMHEQAARALARRGIHTGDWRSRLLDADLVREADLILTSTAAHRGAVVMLEPRALGRTFPILQFSRLVAAAAIGQSDLQWLSPAESGKRVITAAVAARGRLQPVDSGAEDVADPIGHPQDAFDRCLDVLAAAVARIVPVAYRTQC